MSDPTVLVVQHAEECPPAWFGDWLAGSGCRVEVCRPYASAGMARDGEVPDPRTYDALLVLGGPMGAADDEQGPWLPVVRERIRTAVAAEVPTLGICLGHQLIGLALGGAVATNPRGQQIGLLEVGWRAEAAQDPLFSAVSGPRRGVQWNDDLVVRLPGSATVLAATPHGEVQAVRYAPAAWGVQLHPEADLDVVLPWAESDRGSHEARGVDQARLLEEIRVAREELEESWRPLAQRFAELAAAATVGRR